MPLFLPRPLLLWVLAGSLLGLSGTLSAQQPTDDAQRATSQPNVLRPDERPPATKPRYWTKHWSFQDVDVEQLLARLKSIGIPIPIDCAGDVSVEIDVAVPLTNLTSPQAYRFRGRLSANQLRVESLALEEVEADLDYADGVLRLERLKGRWKDANATSVSGSFQGKASAQLLPRGDFQAYVKITSLPLGPLRELWLDPAETPVPVSGTMDGVVSVKAPIDRLRQITAWSADGEASFHDLRFGQTLPLSLVQGFVRIRDGILHAQQVQMVSAISPDIRVDLDADLELTRQRRFQFRIRGNDVPLGAVAEALVPRDRLIDGKLDFDAQGRGALGSESWKLNGRVASPRLTLIGVDLGLIEHQFDFDHQRFQLRPISDAAETDSNVFVKQITANYELDVQSLRIADFNARLFGGTMKGTAHLARSDSGNHTVGVVWENLRPRLNAATFWPGAASAWPGLGAVGSTSRGSVEWSVPAGSLDLPATHRGAVQLQLDQLAVGPTMIGDVRLTLDAVGDRLELGGGGKLLGGDARAELVLLPAQHDSWSTLLARPPAGTVTVDSMRVDAIARVLFPRVPRQWRGTASSQLVWQAGAETWSEFRPTLHLNLNDLAFNGRPLSRQLTMQCTLDGDTVGIDRISGSYAGGRIRASGHWTLAPGERHVQVSFAGVDAAAALVPLSDQLAAHFDGKLSGLVRLTLGERIRFRGAIRGRDSSIFSIPARKIHSAINGSISPDRRHWEISLPSVQGELAGGRIAGEAKLSSSSIGSGAFDLSSRWRARSVDFGALLSTFGSSSSVAHGQLSGNVSLGGRTIRDTADLVGRFDARLNATQARAVPGLVKADQFLGLLSLQGLQFDEGGVTGVIGSGAATIDEFWLRSPQIKVWSDGKVYLANRRLDLDVVIATSSFGFGSSQAVALASQLAIQSVLPVTTLLEVNQLLSNRTVHLDFVGPVTDPRVKLKPLETIREEAARFLLRELLVVGSANSGLKL